MYGTNNSKVNQPWYCIIQLWTLVFRNCTGGGSIYSRLCSQFCTEYWCAGEKTKRMWWCTSGSQPWYL